MLSNKHQFTPTDEAILKTLLYSDIFDFPLTKNELWKLLISGGKITRSEFADALQKLSSIISHKNGFYVLQGREELISNRKQYLEEVQKKLRLAKKAAFYLAHIPTIHFIGISGGVALGNATKDDDIDFFVITKKGTLFMTRFLILSLLEWKNLRRKRTDQEASDKICVNLLLDESKLSWPVKKRDLYIAHEIAQIKPLFVRDNTYQKFLDSNKWVTKFLPNSQDETSVFLGYHWHTNYQTLRFLSSLLFRSPFEGLMQKVQEKYMQKYRTTELVSKTVLAFHPNDYRVKTLTVLRSKCEKLGLLTNF